MPSAADARHPALADTWARVVRLIRRRPLLVLPFVLLAVIEVYALAVLSDTPDVFRPWLNAFISRHNGAPYVFYPLKTAALPGLFSDLRTWMDLFLEPLFTAWMTARVIFLERNEHRGLGGAFTEGAACYLPALAIGFTDAVLSRIAGRGLAFLAAPGHAAPWISSGLGLPLLIALTFIIVTVIQSAFVYAVPAVVGDDRTVAGAIGTSIGLALRRPVFTLLLVGVPALPFFLGSAAASLAPGFTALKNPGLVVNLLLVDIALGFLTRTLVVGGAAVAYERARPEHVVELSASNAPGGLMNKTISITSLVVIAALAAPVRADVTPQDVHDSAHKAGHHIRKNTKEAGEKTKAGAKDAEAAGNRGAYKLRDEKDKAKADIEKDRSEEGGNAKTSGEKTTSHHSTQTTPLRDLHHVDDASGDTSNK